MIILWRPRCVKAWRINEIKMRLYYLIIIFWVKYIDAYVYRGTLAKTMRSRQPLHPLLFMAKRRTFIELFSIWIILAVNFHIIIFIIWISINASIIIIVKLTIHIHCANVYNSSGSLYLSKKMFSLRKKYYNAEQAHYNSSIMDGILIKYTFNVDSSKLLGNLLI